MWMKSQRREVRHDRLATGGATPKALNLFRTKKKQAPRKRATVGAVRGSHARVDDVETTPLGRRVEYRPYSIT